MKTGYYPLHGCPAVHAIVRGPSKSTHVMLMVDTGASFTSLSEAILEEIGSSVSPDKSITVSAAGIFETQSAFLHAIDVAGMIKKNIPVVALTLPNGSGVDGVLGSDFFQNKKLTIDFAKHTIQVKE